jgi:branched-chain amino acid transport system substrate-binding protein
MKRRTGTIVLLLAAVGTLAIVAGAYAKGGKSTATPAACSNVRLGFSGPLTGDAGFLGSEQLSWAQFAVSRFNKQNKTRITIRQGDTQLDPAKSRTVGQQFVADRKLMGIIGPSTSQGVISTADVAGPAKLVMVSPSATRPTLTTKREGGPTFFRNVPNDDVQGPTVANFIIKKLKLDEVAIVEVRANPYSTSLGDIVNARLTAAGIKTTMLTVEADQKDYSTTVTRVPANAKAVVLPWQQPPDAQTFANQLRLQGKRAFVFGTDGTYAPEQFHPTNAYVSAFANDLHFVKAAAPIVKAYNKFSGNKAFGTFGPPSYMAAWILATAVKKGCTNGTLTRTEMVTNVRKTNVASILGGRTKFNRLGDVAGAKFKLFHVVNGKYSPVNF